MGKLFEAYTQKILSHSAFGKKLKHVQNKSRKNRYGHNFQNIGSKMNQRLVIGYDPMLIRFGSDILKIATVLVFLDTANTLYFWKLG